MSNNLATPSESLYPPTTYPTDLDLSTKLGYGVKMSTSTGKVVLSDAQGEAPLGVVRQAPSNTNTDHGVEIVCTPGMAVVMKAGANGVSARGKEVTADGSGLWEDAASSDVVVAQSDRAAASGELFVGYLLNRYTKA